MKKEKVKSVLLNGEVSSLLVLELPGGRIKILADNTGGLDELYHNNKPENFKEAIERAKRVLDIEAEQVKVFKSKKYLNMPYIKIFDIEEKFNERLNEAWA